MNILRGIQNLKEPSKEIREKSEYSNVVYDSLMNLALKKEQMIVEFDDAMDDMFLHALRKYINLDIFLFMNMNILQTTEYFKTNLNNNFVRFGMKTFQVNKKTLFKILQLFFWIRYFHYFL